MELVGCSHGQLQRSGARFWWREEVGITAAESSLKCLELVSNQPGKDWTPGTSTLLIFYLIIDLMSIVFVFYFNALGPN